MKPSILVLYYTQTGQMQRILQSIVSDISKNADIDGVAIEPMEPFSFPWTTQSFFNLLPTTMAHTAIAIKPLPAEITNKNYDLIILGYQPWFLNPSLPMTSFLNSEYAHLLKDKPVITVIGCRKMWLRAQEQIKEYLEQVNSRLVGNIVLNDGMPGPVSSITSARWLFKGKKDGNDILPEAGIAYNDINAAKRWGMPIYKHLVEDNLIDLQRALLVLGAVRLTSAMIVAERYRTEHMKSGARYIQGKDDTGRAKRIKRFKNILAIGYILWPVFILLVSIKLLLNSFTLLKDKEYFRQLQYEKGKF